VIYFLKAYLALLGIIFMFFEIEKKINKLMDILGAISSFLLIILVLVISYNVIGRYAFGASSVGLEEFSWHLYSTVFLLSISYALKTESHVRVDIIFERLSARTQAIINSIGGLFVLLPICGIVVYYGFFFMRDSYQWGDHADSIFGLIHQFMTIGIGEKSSDPGGLLNRFVIKGMVPLSFLFLGLSTVSFIIKNIRLLIESSNTQVK
jgi:TRAP-type mannitol/chloroaromatic compound transport system permease small subunit